jgi:Protein of unknown function (DUF2799)
VRRLSLMISLASMLLTAGCASMSETECNNADWYQQGMREALQGYPKSRLQDHREACAKAGIVPNDTQYMAGYDNGIRQFCTPENAVRWGRAGKSYQNSCPADMDAAFRDRYQAAKAVYDAETRVNNLRNQQSDKQRKLDQTTDENTRKQLRQDLESLDRQLRDARYDLDRADRVLSQ